ncbi:Vps54-like protein-domain-containing protein [Piptocephalis cylindrospora]|uniref:Vps54-like protein-domain-containing protein n=1 Tax=Piptocephalis cylindrospora TaxID=1907219 RepID=A0A4V1IY51_9FUNG|nr:Vps54-like protein-domain-containing protein [Piptocephalis cylindrospora]|eukprot:RKP13339.1 Vps54-like protein-domain-containing protein [Piptocephalis cylindrospora]
MPPDSTRSTPSARLPSGGRPGEGQTTSPSSPTLSPPTSGNRARTHSTASNRRPTIGSSSSPRRDTLSTGQAGGRRWSSSTAVGRYAISGLLNDPTSKPPRTPTSSILGAFSSGTSSSRASGGGSEGSMGLKSSSKGGIRNEIPPITKTLIRRVRSVEFTPYLQNLDRAGYRAWKANSPYAQALHRARSQSISSAEQGYGKDKPMVSPLALTFQGTGNSLPELISHPAKDIPPLPELFTFPDFSLSNPDTFDALRQLFDTEAYDDPELSEGTEDREKGISPPRPLMRMQRGIGGHLDEVEAALLREISQKSPSFFATLDRLRDLHSGTNGAVEEVRLLRLEVAKARAKAEASVRLIRLGRQLRRARALRSAVSSIVHADNVCRNESPEDEGKEGEKEKEERDPPFTDALPSPPPLRPTASSSGSRVREVQEARQAVRTLLEDATSRPFPIPSAWVIRHLEAQLDGVAERGLVRLERQVVDSLLRLSTQGFPPEGVEKDAFHEEEDDKHRLEPEVERTRRLLQAVLQTNTEGEDRVGRVVQAFTAALIHQLDLLFGECCVPYGVAPTPTTGNFPSLPSSPALASIHSPPPRSPAPSSTMHREAVGRARAASFVDLEQSETFGRRVRFLDPQALLDLLRTLCAGQLPLVRGAVWVRSGLGLLTGLDESVCARMEVTGAEGVRRVGAEAQIRVRRLLELRADQTEQLGAVDFGRLRAGVGHFIHDLETLTREPAHILRVTLEEQSGAFAAHFHAQRYRHLSPVVDGEVWAQVEVPRSYQRLVDTLMSLIERPKDDEVMDAMERKKDENGLGIELDMGQGAGVSGGEEEGDESIIDSPFSPDLEASPTLSSNPNGGIRAPTPLQSIRHLLREAHRHLGSLDEGQGDRECGEGTEESVMPMAKKLHLGGTSYWTVGSTLVVLRLVGEYVECEAILEGEGTQGENGVVPDDRDSSVPGDGEESEVEREFIRGFMASGVAGILRQWNSLVEQAILGARAVETAELRNITAKHIALGAQAVGCMRTLLPALKECFVGGSGEDEEMFDEVDQLMSDHLNGLYDKFVEIMSERAMLHCQSIQAIDWDVAGVDLGQDGESGEGGGNEEGDEVDGSPSTYMLLLVKETTTLHRVLTRYLFQDVTRMVMTRVAEMYEEKLQEAMLSLRIKAARGKQRYFTEKIGSLDSVRGLGHGLHVAINNIRV